MTFAGILRTFVRNDAMKNDPEEIYNWRVLALAGCFLACFFTSYLTEKFGRRWSLIGTGIMTTIGVVLSTASTANGSLVVMYVGRFVADLGVGAASTLVPLYVSECAPRAIRGGLTSFYQLFIVTGVMLSFWINYSSVLHLTAPAVYALPLALQALPAAPRWGARKDDWERATRILTNLRMLPKDSPYLRNEIQEMHMQLDAERRLTGDASATTLLKEMLTVPGNRNRTIISVLLMVCQQMTGVNAINYYAPQIFQALGMTGTTVSLFATGGYGVVKVVGCAIFLVFAADSLGRRRSLLWTSVAQATAMFIIARLRAINVALASATQRLFNFIIARTVLTMQATMGPLGYGMFFMFGSFCILMGLFVWFFVPETKGLSLEQMDELFGVVDMTNKLAHENPETGRATSIMEDDSHKKERL
ncbi:quinate permease [Fusarium pseudocircinatum]|uniref:Quinate permease n=1 Tax=Fusarium pseudocircinatum TaxID=56676 RepID=A0A8H5KVK8_9HYPO|nr:quinate permease [Fusarium pseudocircinatum]